MQEDVSQPVVSDSHDLLYFVPFLKDGKDGLIWLNNGDMKVPVKIYYGTVLLLWKNYGGKVLVTPEKMFLPCILQRIVLKIVPVLWPIL